MTNTPSKKRPLKTAKDINKSKLAEETLVQGERKYKALIDTTGTGYVILDSDGRVLDANTEYVRLTGHRSLDDIAGRSVAEWTAPYHREKNIIEVKKCIEKGFVRNLEIDYIDQTGHITPIEINATLLESTEGQHILTLVRDNTERKQAAKSIRKENEFNRLIVENAGEGISVCHAVEEFPFVKFTVWNKRMTDMTGYSMDDINRLGWYQSMYPDAEVQEHAIARMQRMRIGDNLQSEEWEITRADGHKRQILITTRLLTNPDEPQQVLAVMNDITERKRAEEALREREEKMQSIFRVAPTGIGVVKDRILLDVNPRICEMTGYSKEELVGKSARIFYPTQEDFE